MWTKRTMAAIAAATLVATGCSGEDLAERFAENRIESETGQEVDLDFDDGNISIRSEDGELSIQTDDDGNVSVEADSFGDDNESFSIDSENGETVIETEDGTMTFSQNSEVPDGFPSDVPVPGDMAILTVQEANTPDGQAFTVIAESTRSVDDLSNEIIGGLESAGYEQQQLTTTPEGSLFIYVKGDLRVSGTLGTSGDNVNVIINVTPNEG